MPVPSPSFLLARLARLNCLHLNGSVVGLLASSRNLKKIHFNSGFTQIFNSGLIRTLLIGNIRTTARTAEVRRLSIQIFLFSISVPVQAPVNHFPLLVQDHLGSSSSKLAILQLEDPKGPGEVPVSVRDDGELDPLEETHHPRPHADVSVQTPTAEAPTFLNL